MLFLAVPIDIYESFFSLALPQGVVAEYNVKLLVYDPETQEVQTWIN
ncbi:MAG: hypothetical protein KAX40_10240 [Herpetosiphon sp.]|nr:hypothetical protein [Herpetosiphon sp.]